MEIISHSFKISMAWVHSWCTSLIYDRKRTFYRLFLILMLNILNSSIIHCLYQNLWTQGDKEVGKFQLFFSNNNNNKTKSRPNQKTDWTGLWPIIYFASIIFSLVRHQSVTTVYNTRVASTALSTIVNGILFTALIRSVMHYSTVFTHYETFLHSFYENI